MPPSEHENDKIERLRRAMYSRKYGEQMGPRERRALEESESSVPEDWARRQEERPPKPVLPLEAIFVEQRKRVLPILKWALGIAAVFFVCAILFFVYYLYFGGESAISARNIDIAITGPGQIAGGESVDLQVIVTNRNREALDLAELIVTYPLGTRLNQGNCTVNSCRISLGTIEPGVPTAIKLPAIYQGSAGQRAVVHVEVEYRLGGSISIFNASADYAFVFSSAPLSIAVEGNTETISGQLMQLTLTVLSNASQAIPNVLLSVSEPFGFKLASSEPARGGDKLWHLGTLSPGEKKTVTLTGTLSGETGDSRLFRFTAGGRASATSTAIDTPLSDTELAVTIAQPFLKLDLTINDVSSTKAIPVSPGSFVHVAVSYTNNLSTPIDNAIVVARLSGMEIDGATVHSEDGFYRSTDKTVLWDAGTTDGVLEHIDAGASGKLNFTFQVPKPEDLSAGKDALLVISINAAGERFGQSGVPENLQSAVQQKVAVASDLRIHADGLYTNNPFGVTGLLPPKAGVETAYAIAFTITNSTNAIKNARVTALLPPYVRLIGNHYAPNTEEVSFNGNTSVFTWDVREIAPGAGLDGVPPRQVVVEIGFTPSTSQIGSQPILIKNVQLTGVDELTGNAVTKRADDVTTNLTGDPAFSPTNATVVR